MNKKYSVIIGLDMPTDNLKKSSREAESLFERIARKHLESVKRLVAADQGLMRQMTQSQQVITAAINREARAATQIREREARRATQIHAQQTREAEREIKRFERERQQVARDSERAIARLVKQESDTRIREGRRAAQELERSLRQVKSTSEQTAKDSGTSFSTFLGASFFGNLAANAVSAFFGKAKDFLPESTKLAQETQNALKGLTSVSFFRGIDQAEAEAAVKNLRFVRGGIISVGDASTSVKNLLSTGFGLKESIDLMERFSDASAFGKQSALDYGDAIRGATEGVKNQNSILVDNVGITKNLSVILKERGFQLEDLSDKTKGLAAREALYAGLLAESQAQVGDADKLMQGYTGTIAAQDTAYQNLQRAIGDIIITNPALIESNQIVTEQIDDTTRAIKEQGSESGIMAEKMITAWAKVKANLLPFLAWTKNMGHAVLQGILVVITAVVGTVLKTIEMLIQTVASAVEQAVNLAIGGVNLAFAAARQIPGGRMVVPGDIAPFKGAPVELGSATMFGNLLKAVNKFSEIMGRVNKAAEEGIEADRRIDAARELREYQLRFSPDLVRSIDKSANEARLRESRALAETVGNITERTGTAAKAHKEQLSDLEKIDKSSERATMKALYALGQRSGFAAGTNQSAGAHNVGSLHPLGRALDFSVRGKTPARIAQFITELRGEGFTVSDERTRPPGQKVWGGPHLHAQFGAGGIGKDRGFGPAEFAVRALLGDMRSKSIETLGGLSGIQPTNRLTEDEKYLQIRKQSLDYENQLTQAVLRRRNIESEAQESYSQATLDLINIESDLIKFRMQNADDQFTEQRRLLAARSEEVDLLRQLQRVQDDLANGPLNQSLRIQLALMEDISQIRRRDEEAIKSQHRSQLELADAEVFHGEQARANVLDHLSRTKSQTEIFSDAIISSYEAINDVVFRGVQKITGGISILDNLIAGLVTRLTNRLFQKLLDVLIPGGGNGQQSNGGGIGSFLGGLLRPASMATALAVGATGATGTTPFQFTNGGNITGPQAAAAAAAARIGGGGNISAPPSISSQQGQRTIAQIAAAAQGNTSSKIPLMLAGPGKLGALAGLLPMLGLTTGLGLGVAAGGQSTLGKILGGIGGAGLGGALGLMGFTALGGTFTSPALVAALGVLGPIALIAGPLLIAGAIILAKNKQRQKEEKARTQFGGTALEQVYQILWATQRGELTVSAARGQWDRVHSEYMAQVATLKDSKTRRNATLWWDNDVTPIWKQIEEAASVSAKRGNDRGRMSPVFARGGINQLSQLIRVSRGEGWRNPGSNVVNVIPGRFEGREDTEFMFAPRGTEIVPRSKMQGAQGFQHGTGGDWNPNIDIKVYIDKDGMGEAVITSPRFKGAVIRSVKIGRLEKKI